MEDLEKNMLVQITEIKRYQREYKGNDHVEIFMQAQSDHSTGKLEKYLVDHEVDVRKFDDGEDERVQLIMNAIPELEYLSGSARAQVSKTIKSILDMKQG